MRRRHVQWATGGGKASLGPGFLRNDHFGALVLALLPVLPRQRGTAYRARHDRRSRECLSRHCRIDEMGAQLTAVVSVQMAWRSSAKCAGIRYLGCGCRIGYPRQATWVYSLISPLSARGLTTREIPAHFAEVYGATASKDKVCPSGLNWRASRSGDHSHSVGWILRRARQDSAQRSSAQGGICKDCLPWFTVEQRIVRKDCAGVPAILMYGRVVTMVCDVCNEETTPNSTYFLTTAQVVLNIRYWREEVRRFRAIGNVLGGIGGEALAIAVPQMAGQRSAWAVCEACAGMFEFDRELASAYAVRQQQPPGCGPVDVRHAQSIAAQAWNEMAGTSVDMSGQPAPSPSQETRRVPWYRRLWARRL
jgi:hypothetical protein